MRLRYRSLASIPRATVARAGELSELLLQTVPLGIIVLDDALDVTYFNAEGRRFLRRYGLPEEVPRISRRILDAFHSKTPQELFPGEVHIERNLGESARKWLFKLHVVEGVTPRIAVFITEEAVSNCLSMNEIRKKYRLTRRETDVLRRVLRGLKNDQIAEDLNITLQTVKGHLTNIYSKIGIENRNELMRIFVRPAL